MPVEPLLMGIKRFFGPTRERQRSLAPELLEQADIVVQGVPSMVSLLREMVEMLERTKG
jgi:hypothetical protein